MNWLNNILSIFSKNKEKKKEKINKSTKISRTSTGEKKSNDVKQLEEATMSYILTKYKKESFKIMREHIEKSNIDGLNEERMDELKNFLESILLVVEDDFFRGYRVLKGRMVKIDQYLFSQYKKDPILKKNIYKVLLFAQNKRFSNHLKENLTAYFALIEELGFEIIHFLEDYHKTMEELEINPRAGLHVKKDYGLKNFIKEEEGYDYTKNPQSVNFLTSATEAVGLAYKSPFDKNKEKNKEN